MRSGQSHLHDLPQVHHRHLVAHELHHPKVVGNEEVGQPELFLEVPEQVHDLRLDRDVERARGFVGNEELRAHGKHTRNTDPPLLSARELVREVRELALF